jgi:hypothetical protein
MSWAVIASLVFSILKHFLGEINEKEYIATILVHFISSFSVSRIQGLLRNYSNIISSKVDGEMEVCITIGRKKGERK